MGGEVPDGLGGEVPDGLGSLNKTLIKKFNSQVKFTN